MWYVVGPMVRLGARGLGPGLGLKYDNCFAGRAGTGHTFFCGRDGPHNSICGPGPGRVCTTAAGPGRAWPGLKSYLSLNIRPVQGPNVHLSRVTRRTTLDGNNRCEELIVILGGIAKEEYMKLRIVQYTWYHTQTNDNLCFDLKLLMSTKTECIRKFLPGANCSMLFL